MYPRWGLFEGAGLSEIEVWSVLSATGSSSVTERIDGRFFDVWAEGETLRRELADSGIEDLLVELWDRPGGGLSNAQASYAELCVLVPQANCAFP